MLFYLLHQDFRGISSFQPLTLTVEHIIKPLSLSKPSLFIPEVQLAQMSQHLDWTLEPLRPFCAYQQQVDVPTFQLPPQPSQVEITTPYAPQTAEQAIPAATSSMSLPLIYGVCVEGTDHADRSSQPDQRMKEVSPDHSGDGKLQTQGLGKSCSHWHGKEQQSKVALWKSRDRLESVKSQASPGQTQLLMQSEGLENPRCVPQLSLSLLEQGGCYRQQAELPLLLSAGKTAPDYVAEEELLAPLAGSLLLSVRTGNDFPGEEHPEPWMLPESFPHPARKDVCTHAAETAGMQLFPAAKELSCTELSVSPASGSGWDRRTPLTMLFKDLDLKVQWDEEDSSEFS